MSNLRLKNVIHYVIPTMLSNVCFFLFTIVDGIFVGQGVGTNALGAVNIVMPFVMAVNAVFMLINIGGVSIAAIRLGRGDTDGANRVFRQSTWMLILASALMCALGTLLTGPLCTMLGATETYHTYAVDYMFWWSLFIIPNGISMGLQAYCRNDNAPGLVSIAVIASTAANIFLDWLLIYPIPWGTRGAALATGISQTISMLVVLSHFVMKKGVLRFGGPLLDGKLIGSIVVHGLPEGIGQLATPIMTLCMNLVLVSKIGDIGINAFSIISYVASFTVAVFFGTSEGLQPLFGLSYGARNRADLRYYFKAGVWINFIGSVVLTGIVILLSRPICALFGADAVTLEYVLKVLPLYAWGFVVMSFNVMISAYLYSTDHSVQSIFINMLRSIVVSSIVILALPAIFGADIVWFTFGIYEAIVLIAAWFLLRYAERHMFHDQ